MLNPRMPALPVNITSRRLKFDTLRLCCFFFSLFFFIQQQNEGDFPNAHHKSKSTKLFVCRLWVIGTSNKIHFMTFVFLPTIGFIWSWAGWWFSSHNMITVVAVVHHGWWFVLFIYIRFVNEEGKQSQPVQQTGRWWIFQGKQISPPA